MRGCIFLSSTGNTDQRSNRSESKLDEHGNFIESKDEVLESEDKPFKITYHFRANKTKDKPK